MAEKNTSQNKFVKKKKIGVLFSTVDNPFYDSLLQGMKEHIDDLGNEFEIVFRETVFSVPAQCKKLKELVGMDLSGLILTPIDNPEVLEQLVPYYDKNIPIVTLNSDLPRSRRLAFVGSDNFKCGRASGELLKLITGGRGEVAVVTGSRDFVGHEKRIAGFKEYLKENCPKLTIEDIIECKNDDYTAYDLTNRLLLAYPTLSALYFTAGGVFGACKALDQMTVPRNISVVAFDITERTKEYMKKGIITAALVQDPVGQGKKAMEILCNHISYGKDPESEQVLFPVTVILKEMVS